MRLHVRENLKHHGAHQSSDPHPQERTIKKSWSERDTSHSECEPYSQRRRAHILIVDDNRADARLVEEALKETKVSHHVTVLGTGEEALQFLRQGSPFTHRPDIILLDLYLPRMCGKKVLEEIKSDPHLRSIPVVMISGSTRPEDIRESYEAHANCFLQKPMDLNNLVKLLAHVTEFWLSFALPTHQV